MPGRIRETLEVCKKGHYILGDKKIDLKLSLDKMEECKVFLPQEIMELSYTKTEDSSYKKEFCKFDCINDDSFSLACKRIKENADTQKILVLNLANPVNIGGGVYKGSKAQEEDLCRASTLLISLESKEAKRYYEYNRGLNTYMGSDAVIITPNVEIIKNRDGRYLDESIIVSVMTCAAPCVRNGMEGLSQKEYKSMIYNRIVGMLRCAAYMGYKNLVLGAFGCGAFYNDARVVSDLFYKAIEEFDFDGATTNDLFSRIDFAVLSTYKQTYNFDEFYRNFGGENFYCKTVCDKEENRKPVFFWHEYEENGCFSNWYKSPFKIGTVTYQNVEQYLMAQKAKLFRDEYVYKKILKESSPAACKKLGKEVRNFDTFVWEKRRYGILYKGVKAKFSQNPELKEKLLNTRDRVIAEASPYDKIYGIGLTAKDAEIISPSRWVGKNLLGQVLMDVRKKLGHKNVFKKFLLGFNKN